MTALVAAGATVSVLRLGSPLPPPDVHIAVPDSIAFASGTPVTVPVPPSGGFLMQSDSGSDLAALAADAAKPIGSVAKVMTALVVLQTHPLSAGAEGPVVTLSAQDVAFYDQEVAAGGSAVKVTAGETLTERQLLLALLLPSANNIAATLAVWVSGSVAAFVAQENTQATTLGMAASHFDDASGFSPATVASPRDLVKLAKAALGIPALADVVHTQTAVLPDGTQLSNINILLGTDAGWLGLKTGWTGAAGGCLLFAAQHTYASSAPPLTVYGAVLDQGPDVNVDTANPELGGAFAAARNGMAAAFAGYAAVDLSTVTPALGDGVSEPWGERSGVHAEPASGTVVARIGEPVALQLTTTHAPAAPLAGTEVGTLRAPALRGGPTWRVVTTTTIAGPSFWWHLLNA